MRHFLSSAKRKEASSTCTDHGAKITRLTILHYDADYKRIAKLTAQAEQWIVPRGSVA